MQISMFGTVHQQTMAKIYLNNPFFRKHMSMSERNEITNVLRPLYVAYSVFNFSTTQRVDFRLQPPCPQNQRSNLYQNLEDNNILSQTTDKQLCHRTSSYVIAITRDKTDLTLSELINEVRSTKCDMDDLLHTMECLLPMFVTNLDGHIVGIVGLFDLIEKEAYREITQEKKEILKRLEDFLFQPLPEMQSKICLNDLSHAGASWCVDWKKQKLTVRIHHETGSDPCMQVNIGMISHFAIRPPVLVLSAREPIRILKSNRLISIRGKGPKEWVRVDSTKVFIDISTLKPTEIKAIDTAFRRWMLRGDAINIW
eukprot:103800_1